MSIVSSRWRTEVAPYPVFLYHVFDFLDDRVRVVSCEVKQDTKRGDLAASAEERVVSTYMESSRHERATDFRVLNLA